MSSTSERRVLVGDVDANDSITRTVTPGSSRPPPLATVRTRLVELFLWDGFEMFSLLGTVLLLVGLARAGVLAWWNLAIFVAGFTGLMFVP